jgi:hypothetical protein
MTRVKTNKTKPRRKRVKELKTKPKLALLPRKEPFWKARCTKAKSTGGRPPAFDSPEELQQAVNEYFQWVEDNPLIDHRAIGVYYGEPVTKDFERLRPMTIGGLCLFLNISDQTWREYRKGTYGEAFSWICVLSDRVIREQKFAGAAAGFFNHAIIARDLGLVDRTDITSAGNELKNQSVVVLPAKEGQ